MKIEYIIELGSCILALGLLFFGVPKSKLREMSVSILLMQSLTWLLGGIVVELKLIEYPTRLFSYAFRTSFTFEFIVFPIISVLFNLYFPKKSPVMTKILYSITFPTILIIGEVILKKYTNNIKYIQWNWFYSWSSMWLTLLLAYGFYKWFFQKPTRNTGQRNGSQTTL
ncbi:CBO0543 family protein [Neobacillus kokaensis]|uniref:Histidine kinase N-terminal 7TM region domain-containing protein n=1 Tax=Neobacillus kokaensis TaxID=2759023 RepID=A0ABQ3N7A1_9BACI|nr:CBO0543 family protein [Neobacillus kokaensis]GHH99472.1 hypothetical protein AM1BK_30150 [Neobacillus kokaensis]